MDTQLLHDHKELDGLLKTALTALRSGNAPESLKALDLFWARLAVHIRAEHLQLFPAILEAGDPGHEKEKLRHLPADVIEELREDHDFFMKELADGIKKLRAADSAESVKTVQKSLTGLVLRLARHNQIEESQIYPLADLLLADEARSRLTANIRRELENMPSRFAES